MPTRQERIEGGLIGLLVGDALGVPYEFTPAAKVPPPESIEFTPPPGFAHAYGPIPPGTWSDDGAHALCLLDSLLRCQRLDPADLGGKLLDWFYKQHYAVDGRVFDIGVQTRRALLALREGVPALDAGPAEERANGNGSLMRVLPLALWHQGSDAELVADARAQSRVTHGHIRSQACCALYCLWARCILEEAVDPWKDAVVCFRSLAAEDRPFLAEMETHVRPDDPPGGKGEGYVVDCLRSARWAVGAGPYEQVVKAAIALGNDTDTTASVAGGIAGLRDGIGSIPERWRLGLRGREMVEPLLKALLARDAQRIASSSQLQADGLPRREEPI